MIRFKSWPFSKWILSIVALIVVGFALYFFVAFIVVIYALSDFSHTYSAKDLAENFDSHKIQIEEVARYIQTVVPGNHDVHIEFNDDNTFEIFHVTLYNPQFDVCGHHYEYKVDMDSDGARKQMSFLGWTEETIDTLYQKLKAADCISVETSSYGNYAADPVTIGYRRSGMGMYFYKLLEEPVTDSLVAAYTDSGTCIWYNNEVLLEYGGGAVGRQGFTDEEVESVNRLR